MENQVAYERISHPSNIKTWLFVGVLVDGSSKNELD